MAILAIILSGFVIGALARWAVPGPDPMPFWLTVLIGLAGSWVGAGISAAWFGRLQHPTHGQYFAMLLLSIVAATVLVILYRRFVQKRPITGPEAHKLPTRGIGVNRLRLRMGPRATKSDVLQHLDELHEQGLLTDEEYVARRKQVLRQG